MEVAFLIDTVLRVGLSPELSEGGLNVNAPACTVRNANVATTMCQVSYPVPTTIPPSHQTVFQVGGKTSTVLYCSVLYENL